MTKRKSKINSKRLLAIIEWKKTKLSSLENNNKRNFILKKEKKLVAV